MKNLFLLLAILAGILVIPGCDKDGEKNYNTVKITDGEFSGFSLTFSPNQGFWSTVNESTRQVHLVFGDDENIISNYENVMDILFYYNGQPEIIFPSAEGQWIEMGLNIDGLLYYFQLQDAVLVIYHMDDYFFEGALSGEFTDSGGGSGTTTLTMDIRIDLQEI